MTPEQISALVASGESQTLEFKATTGTRREAAATVCAMLNQRGGHVLFGVTPEGSIVGQQVSERTLEEVSTEIQRIDPAAFPEIETVQVSGDLKVIAVRVSRGSSPPYQYRGASYSACRQHDPGHVGRRIQPGALGAHAQRAALGEPARRRMACR